MGANKVMVQQDTDTTLWGGVAMILVLISSDLWIQALVGIFFPAVGWTVLYFIKREIVHRFPPKDPKDLLEGDNDKIA